MDQNTPMAVIGLGYVGLPAAIAFAKKFSVIGFDTDPLRIQTLQQGRDTTGEIANEAIRSAKIHYTSDPKDLALVNFYIVAVPTPLDASKKPDLSALSQACEMIAPYLKKGDIVVIESTVYPGATQKICIPLLEHYSNLKASHDFSVGYSPERINPGDPAHGFTQTVKIVSALDAETLDIIADRYAQVIEKGVYATNSIMEAEASKLIENIQRDVNIALMNECAQILQALKIETLSVLKAAATKWNFLPFSPGFVGGHCIGVAPYHLMYQADNHHIRPELMATARRVNESMEQYVADLVVKQLIASGHAVRHAVITILGFTYKENCHDIRFTRCFQLIQALEKYGITVQVHDPIADPHEVYKEYEIELVSWEDLPESDGVILCVPHEYYKNKKADAFYQKLKDPKWLLDFKGGLDKEALTSIGIALWRL